MAKHHFHTAEMNSAAERHYETVAAWRDHIWVQLLQLSQWISANVGNPDVCRTDT